jgi:hypothetical protein
MGDSSGNQDNNKNIIWGIFTKCNPFTIEWSFGGRIVDIHYMTKSMWS